MDYFSVIVLTIVAFIFVSDRKIKSINLLAKENNDIIKSIDSVLKDLEIYKLNTEKVDYEKFLEIIRDSKNEYILIQNDGL